ncbi:sugar ABC transporter substrate-binding protein [Cohnella lubricantis]|uniref:Sugar ABC transporter substrate-binding protein n=1 Tax=Cohnella lubricantis TaxID=2163172 RepID=A0A841TCK2_9BACL|nr:sugar ABC transporter substrate-binding protein [Cohnella lubricantis]MBB6677739.1 sugar ABC transporter substrate-binding protein [Cohnella lubricantis]MBP2117701.1 simple sugar transport system substrate-binding protein [Cohnella lubricantis]
MLIKKRIGAVLALSLALVLALTACGSKNNTASKVDNPLAGKKIALVMQFNQGTFSAQYIDGVKKQAAKFGGEVTVFASENDLSKMASNLDAAINQKFDGILIDHGNTDALGAGVEKAKAAGIPVVAFDAALGIDGVTDLSQNDQKMAEQTLEQLAKDAGGKGNIVKVWVAGFAPMERRQESYAAFQQQYPDIKEITSFGDASNPQLDAQTKMEAILKQYPEKGSITAVWAAWDEFAKGAANAIKQAGRDEIKVYGIDMSDEDLTMIQDPTSPWIASAAVDPTTIGTVQVRYLYQALHGDQTDAAVQIDSVYVSRDALPQDKQVTTADLAQYVPGWGESDQGNTDYLKELEAAVAAAQ